MHDLKIGGIYKMSIADLCLLWKHRSSGENFVIRPKVLEVGHNCCIVLASIWRQNEWLFLIMTRDDIGWIRHAEPVHFEEIL